jgi:S-adenosylmethionine hydrolase
MIVLASDFGPAGPYVGQMTAAVLAEWPEASVVDLAHDLPRCDPRRAAYLFAAYAAWFPPETVFVCVVDPGVGSAERRPVAMRVDGRTYVGPDNGLFEPVMRRAAEPVRAWRIDWMPERLSASFHGRDLFAPVAARIARDGLEDPAAAGLSPIDPDGLRRTEWPDDLDEVLAVDSFGNLISGLRAAELGAGARIRIGGRSVACARTFSDVAPGQAFWYANSQGLAEVAVNGGSAARVLRAGVGESMVVSE